MIEETQLTVWFQVPARQAQHFTRQVIGIQTREGNVEEDVGVGNNHPLADKVPVGVREEVFISQSPSETDQSYFVTLKRGIAAKKPVVTVLRFDKKANFANDRIGGVTSDTFDELQSAVGIGVEIETSQKNQGWSLQLAS
jgi:hypothetical protein